MLNPTVGVQRVFGRLRRPEHTDPSPELPPATTLRVRSRSAARQMREDLGSAAATAHLLPTSRRRRGRALGLPTIPFRAVTRRIGHDRVTALVVAGIVLGAAGFSVIPGAASQSQAGDTGGTNGAGTAPRLIVADALGGIGIPGTILEDYASPESATLPNVTAAIAPSVDLRAPLTTIDSDPEALAAVEALEAAVVPVEGPFLADGTLLKPVAVDTVVADGAGLVETYKVKAGDSLAGIAKRFKVSTMTIVWANKLKSLDDLRQGQKLRIPPVSGLIVNIKAGDTLEGLAKQYKVDADKVLATNELTDTRLVVGQVLVLPGAKGDPLPKPKPQVSSGGGGGGGGTTPVPPKTYGGGGFAWPTSSHHVSQYYHYGHYGVDIDGSTGDPIYAAAGGTVTFAGWKSNGGGYQVWIAHGSGLYTTYNHMSSVSAYRGQVVGKGQRIGRMGASGMATGSHLHFEVWRGPIWNGGRRVNPLGYL